MVDLSVVILRMNVTSIVTVGILVGAVFAFACVNEFIVGIEHERRWKAIHWIRVAFLFALSTLWGTFQPVQMFFALASFLAAPAPAGVARDALSHPRLHDA